MSGSFVVGVDLVVVDAIRDSLESFGDRFLRRIFTEHEIEYCTSRVSEEARLESLAARFAAKEAVIKALNAPERGVDFRSIEVLRESGGACRIALSGAAERAREELGAGALSLSMSHASGYAVAIVIGAKEERVRA